MAKRSLPRATRLANIAAKKPKAAARINAKSEGGKKVLRIGSKAFNKMFPQLGRLLGGVYRGGSNENQSLTSGTPTAQITNNLYGQILENQNRQNDILNQILQQVKNSNNTFLGPSLLNNNPSNNNQGGGTGNGPSNNNRNNNSVLDDLLTIAGLGATGYSTWDAIRKLSRSGPTVRPPTNVPRPGAPPEAPPRPGAPPRPSAPPTPEAPPRPGAPGSRPGTAPGAVETPRPAPPGSRPGAPPTPEAPPRPGAPGSRPGAPPTPEAPPRPGAPPRPSVPSGAVETPAPTEPRTRPSVLSEPSGTARPAPPGSRPGVPSAPTGTPALTEPRTRSSVLSEPSGTARPASPRSRPGAPPEAGRTPTAVEPGTRPGAPPEAGGSSARPTTPGNIPPRPATPPVSARPAAPPGTATTIPRPVNSLSISQRIAQASTIEELRAIQNLEFERLGTTQRQALENIRSVERARVIQRQTSQQVDQLQRLVSRRAEQLIPPTVSAVPSSAVSVVPGRGIPTPNVGTSSLPPLSSSSAPIPRIPPTVTAVPPPAAIPRPPGPINLVAPPPPPAAGPATPVVRQRISTLSESRVPRSTPYRSIRLGLRGLRILGSLGLRVLGIASGVYLVYDVYVGLVELKARTVSISVRNRQTFFTTLNNLIRRLEAYNGLLDQFDNETDQTKIQDLENTIKEENAEISSQYDRIIEMAENLDKEYNEDVARRLRNGQNIPENQRQAPYLNILANIGISGVQQPSDATPATQNKDESDGSGGGDENGGSGGDATPVNNSSVSAKQVENIPAPQQRQNNSSSTVDTTSQILYTLRTRESGNNYRAQNPVGSASGAYQFIDRTWRGVTRQFGIGTEYRRAIDAPPEIQDAVAAAYVNSILAANNNDISVVPLVWYTGNAQGRMTAEALAVNRGLTSAQYQANWMRTFQRQHGNVPLPQNVQRSSTPQSLTSRSESVPQTGSRLTQAGTNMVAADQRRAKTFQEILSSILRIPGQQNQMGSASSNNIRTNNVSATEVPLRNRLESAFGLKKNIK